MDGNKDEAIKCVKLAESALKSGDKTRALKFIRIAVRLDPNIKINHILSPSENPNPSIPTPNKQKTPLSNQINQSEPSQKYSEENVKVIREIRTNRDYYTILGITKSSTGEEIKRAYKKLSLKVHPDKNKAPGAEEAFKSLSKAFNCLNNEQSRVTYDQTGNENYNHTLQNENFTHRTARRRNNPREDYFDENFQPDDIFRSFFFGTQGGVHHRNHNHNRQRNYYNTPRHNNPNNPNMADAQNNACVLIICILFFFILVSILASLPTVEPEYSFQKTHIYQLSKNIEDFGVEYFVRREDFEMKFPKGSGVRENLEREILRDYKGLLRRYCHVELKRKYWDDSHPTPYCDELRGF